MPVSQFLCILESRLRQRLPVRFRLSASIEYTFPLDFAELVWSDGSKVDRQIIDLTDTTAFGTKDFRIPFDATGKKWVRFPVWDSAGNGAWLQPK
jgi:hypothetical protein